MPETWSLELYYRWFGLVWLVDLGHGHRGCKFVPHLLHRTAVLSCTSFWNLFGSIVLRCFALFCIVLHVQIDIRGADGTESARHESPDQARDMDMKTQQATAPSPKRHTAVLFQKMSAGNRR